MTTECLKRGKRTGVVEFGLAAGKIVRIEIAKDDAGICDGWDGATIAVADRAGNGARALRPNFEQTTCLKACD